jgi:hypothetical protein
MKVKCLEWFHRALRRDNAETIQVSTIFALSAGIRKET